MENHKEEEEEKEEEKEKEEKGGRGGAGRTDRLRIWGRMEGEDVKTACPIELKFL